MKTTDKIKLGSFTRIVWLNQEARDQWENTINEIFIMVQNLELESVKHGHRLCAWRTIDSKDLPAFAKQMQEIDLIVTPVLYVGKWEGFSHVTVPVEEGKPFNVSCVVSKGIPEAVAFREAHALGDHVRQGELLGFPKCCREAFSDTWDKGFFDPMFQLAQKTFEEKDPSAIGKIGEGSAHLVNMVHLIPLVC